MKIKKEANDQSKSRKYDFFDLEKDSRRHDLPPDVSMVCLKWPTRTRVRDIFPLVCMLGVKKAYGSRIIKSC